MVEPALRVALGVVFVVTGVIAYRYAYTLAWFSEQLDAIGSKTPADEVEPADWNVALTRYSGAAGVLVGLFFILVYGPALL